MAGPLTPLGDGHYERRSITFPTSTRRAQIIGSTTDVIPYRPTIEIGLSTINAADLTDATIAAAFEVYGEVRSPASVRRALSTWRSFCQWMTCAGYLGANPLDSVRSPGRNRSLPRPLSAEEVERLFAVATTVDDRTPHPWAERDVAVLAVLAGVGIRADELIASRVDSVGAGSRGLFQVVGSRAERVVPIGPGVEDLIARYLRSREERFGDYRQHDPLFVRVLGPTEQPEVQPFTPDSLGRLLLRLFARAAVAPPPRALARSFRSTYAAMLFLSGTPVAQVQQLLGHAKRENTKRYMDACLALGDDRYPPALHPMGSHRLSGRALAPATLV